jgi:hypothetical protein
MMGALRLAAYPRRGPSARTARIEFPFNLITNDFPVTRVDSEITVRKPGPAIAGSPSPEETRPHDYRKRMWRTALCFDS